MLAMKSQAIQKFKLNNGQKMLRFRKVTTSNLKIGKLSVTFATSNFQELFVVKLDVKLIKNINIFVEGIYYRKTKSGNAPISCKIGLSSFCSKILDSLAEF